MSQLEPSVLNAATRSAIQRFDQTLSLEASIREGIERYLEYSQLLQTDQQRFQDSRHHFLDVLRQEGEAFAINKWKNWFNGPRLVAANMLRGSQKAA